MASLILNTVAVTLCSVMALFNAMMGNAWFAAILGALAGANGILLLMHIGLLP